LTDLKVNFTEYWADGVTLHRL